MRPTSPRVGRSSSIGRLTGPFRILGGIILLALGAGLYIYLSGYAASIQSCLNGFACSLGLYLQGNSSQLQSELIEAQIGETLAIVFAVVGVAVLAYGLYNTAQARK